MWPGFKSRCRRHIWVEVVVGSFPCSARSCFFLERRVGVGKGGGGGTPFYSSPQKPTHTNYIQFDLERTSY